MRPPALLLAALLLAGCAAPASGPAPQGTPSRDDSALAFDAPASAMRGCPALRGIACFEPSLAVDGEGRVFVASTVTQDAIAVSTDGGRSFARVAAPPLPLLAPPGSARGDMTFQADPQGRMYASALVFRIDVPLGQALAGLQVARTGDGGRSWDVNTLLTLPQGATGADRQWLAFGADEVVYLAYWQWFPGASSWVARSEDGGRTFGPFRPSNPVFAGVPAVTDEGRLVVPYHGESPRTLSGRVSVALSDDGGATFREVVVRDGDGAWPGRWPVSALAPDGTLLVAWRDAEGRVLLARSADDGETWAEPEAWTRDGERARLAPWLEAGAGGVTLGWYADTDGGQAFVVARGTTPADATYAIAGHIDEEKDTTDFAQLDVAPDGSVLAAWADPDAGILVARAQ